MKSKGSLPLLQESTNGSYPKSNSSSALCPTFQLKINFNIILYPGLGPSSGLFLSGFPVRATLALSVLMYVYRGESDLGRS